MKRIILLIVLVIINCVILYTKIESSNIDKIDLELKNNEVGVVFFDDLILFKINNKNIVYLLDNYKDSNTMVKLKPFVYKLDYVLMNKNHNINIGDNKIIDDEIEINDIEFDYDDYLEVKYYNYKLCVDVNEVNDCDFLFYTKNNKIFINENTKAIFYSNNIDRKYIDNFSNKWIDSYKIGNGLYTVMKINSFYEVIEIVK